MSRIWLLSVGVGDYGGQAGLPNLRCAVADAVGLYAVLTTRYNAEGKLLVSKVELARRGLTESETDALRPNRRTIIEQIGEIGKKCRTEDVFMFYFAGHAVPKPLPAFLPADAALNRVATHLNAWGLLSAIGRIRCQRRIVLLDCCHAGIMTQALVAAAREDTITALLGAVAEGETPDAVAGYFGGDHSPFAGALIRLFETPREDATISFSDLNDVVRKAARQAHGLEPCSQMHPFERPMTVVRAPKIQLSAVAAFDVVAGRWWTLPLGALLGGRTESNFVWQWKWEADSPRAESERSSPANRPEFRFRFAGVYRLEISVHREGDVEHIARRVVTVGVSESAVSRLRIQAARLAPCVRGQQYSATLILAGGNPPYALADPASGKTSLPIGLAWSLADRLDVVCAVLQGVVPDSPERRRAERVSRFPIRHAIELAVRDTSGVIVREELTLIVFSTEDYVEISPGRFEIGYPDDPDLDRAVGPQIAARSRQLNPFGFAVLPRFWIRRYPVTNREWRAYITQTRAGVIPRTWSLPAPEYFPLNMAELPVVHLSLRDMQHYCSWKGTRLPTAWEWERAARGTEGRQFPWGDDFDARKCNVRESGHGALLPVDAHDRDDTRGACLCGTSQEGVSDLCGNAAEVVDRRMFIAPEFVQPFRGGSFLDPWPFALTFVDSLEAAEVRGGTHEIRTEADIASRWVGFRDVIDPGDEPATPQDVVSIAACEIRFEERRYVVPGFRMARYTVSNLEYLSFVRAESSARTPGSWCENAVAPFPLSQAFLPVTGISPRDALAFCFWKSRETGEIVRLPTHLQWLAAVEGGQNRNWPWGDRFDAQRCNGLTSGWGRVVPVHWLSEGDNPASVRQLVGNVIQWCRFDPPLQSQEWGGVGGSFRFDIGFTSRSTEGLPSRARATIQSASADTNRSDDGGFRYVILDPL